jgi:hypothetical protein
MRRVTVLSIMFVLSVIASGFADTSIKAEVDKLKLSTDEALSYKLTISSTDKRLPVPQVPSFKGFNQLSQSESSNMSFVKNTIETILIYEFILVPTGEGKFKIEPSSIRLKDKTISSDSFEIEVTLGKVKPEAPAETKPAVPEENLPDSEEPQVTL